MGNVSETCLPYGGSGRGAMSIRGHPRSASPAPAPFIVGELELEGCPKRRLDLFHLRGGRRADAFGEPLAWGAFDPQRGRPAVVADALGVFLMVAHAVPVHRCAELIESLTGARPSPGLVHALLARAAAAVADANKAIRALIILAHVVCADETPIRVGPGPKSRKRYLLVACTKLLTWYLLGDRSLATFRAFVLPDMAGTVIVHDRPSAWRRRAAAIPSA